MEYSVNKRIKYLRDFLGLSQIKFIEPIHISQPALSNIEKGLSSPLVETIINIAVVYGISCDWLLLETGGMYRKEVMLSELENVRRDIELLKLSVR